MSYNTGSVQQSITLLNEEAQDLDNGRSDSGRSNLQQVQQFFERCKDTHAEANSWLAKTNQKLSESQA